MYAISYKGLHRRNVCMQYVASVCIGETCVCNKLKGLTYEKHVYVMSYNGLHRGNVYEISNRRNRYEIKDNGLHSGQRYA